MVGAWSYAVADSEKTIEITFIIKPQVSMIFRILYCSELESQ
jgi:hypothetical protein